MRAKVIAFVQKQYQSRLHHFILTIWHIPYHISSYWIGTLSQHFFWKWVLYKCSTQCIVSQNMRGLTYNCYIQWKWKCKWIICDCANNSLSELCKDQLCKRARASEQLIARVKCFWGCCEMMWCSAGFVFVLYVGVALDKRKIIQSDSRDSTVWNQNWAPCSFLIHSISSA